jgi:hypothetical protein
VSTNIKIEVKGVEESAMEAVRAVDSNTITESGGRA